MRGSRVVGVPVDAARPPSTQPQILIRIYRGRQQSGALAKFDADAQQLAAAGYEPVSQSWAQGEWGCGAFLVALVLFVFVLGILIFISVGRHLAQLLGLAW
jgi:hypothetical protein